MTIPYGPRYRAAIAALIEWGERRDREQLAQESNEQTEQDAAQLDASGMVATGEVETVGANQLSFSTIPEVLNAGGTT